MGSMKNMFSDIEEPAFSLEYLMSPIDRDEEEVAEADSEELECSLSELLDKEPVIDIKSIIKEAGLKGLELEAPVNSRVGEAPILDNGLNLLYAPASYGKSYTSVAIAVESKLPSLFIDLESNGKMFIDHCRRNGVEYVYAGSAENILESVLEMVKKIKEKHSKAFIIIDSYSDLFPDDEGKMAQYAQKKLGEINRFFMREVEFPVLLLDHATESRNQEGNVTGFKIEGNKSGKHKKTLTILRLETIGKNIENGTFITVERSRNQDELTIGHTQHYRRTDYLKKKLQALIEEGKLKAEFTATELKGCTSGDDRKLWQTEKEEIAYIERKEGKKEYWKLK